LYRCVSCTETRVGVREIGHELHQHVGLRGGNHRRCLRECRQVAAGEYGDDRSLRVIAVEDKYVVKRRFGTEVRETELNQLSKYTRTTSILTDNECRGSTLQNSISYYFKIKTLTQFQ